VQKWVAIGVGQFARRPVQTMRSTLAASKEVSARMENNDCDISDSIKRETNKFGFVNEAKMLRFV